MEKRLKRIIVALVVLLAITFLIIFSIQSSKLALLREYNDTKERLTKENQEFSKKLKAALTEGKDLQNRLKSIQEELEQMSAEKIELQRKYELVNKERTDLLEKLKTQAQAKGIGVPSELEKRVPTPISEDAYWAEILRTKADLELQVKSLTEKLSDLQMSNQQLQNEMASSELKITGLNQEKQGLERKLQYNDRLLNSISTEMVHEKNKIHQLQREMTTIKQENGTLRGEIKRLDRQRLAFAERLSNLLKERERLLARVDEAELTLDEKVSQMERMHHEFEELLRKVKTVTPAPGVKPTGASVELPPIVVSSSPVAEAEVSKPIRQEGKILTVDHEHNFVVIDLGQNDEVSVGMAFEVFRGDMFIGKVEVIQLREEIAACDIIQIDTPFKIGDIVRY